MHLYLVATLERLKVEPAYFFRLAHQWRFNRDAEVTRDVLEYKQGGIIPQYVQEYVQHIQKGEQDNAMPKV